MSFNWRRQILLWTIFIFSCLCIRGVYFYYNLQTTLDIPDIKDQPYSFLVKPGTSFSQISNQLQRTGLLPQTADLLIYARLSGKAKNIKAGEYALDHELTALDLLNKLVAGDTFYHQLQLVEGWSLHQALQAIQNNPHIVNTLPLAYSSAVTKIQNTFSLVTSPEGMFFPDTYHFSKGSTDLEVLHRAHQRLTEVLTEEWAGRDVGLPYETPYQALIMASIIEKETGLASERAQIAGVFVRRIRQGMRLQTDPTVIYGLGHDFNGNLTRTHLRTPTAYNTYTNFGLPPGPIALVGREAITASLHPDQGTTLYFVAKGDGSHFFSATLDQHNQAVQQYQVRNRTTDYTSQPR